ncbi:MAG: hypothetical protein J5736_02075 [Bacilli bacterium]|nr:hypothetical protein [Bacilli bacterium]
MEYEEFRKCKEISDPTTLAKGFQDEKGNLFYVEPGFYYNLRGFQDKRPDDYEKLLSGMKEAVEKHHKVIFTGNFEAPFMEKEGFVYLEIEDISDPLRIFFEDKSRGSDYGD